MITQEQLGKYLAGGMDATERDHFEEALADDPKMLRELLEQEKIDTALRMLLGKPGRERVLASIAAVVGAEATSGVKNEVMREVAGDWRAGQARPARPWVAWWAAGLAAAVMAMLGLYFARSPEAKEAGGIGQMAETRGRILVVRGGAELEVSDGFTLLGGDLVQTGPAAAGVIRITDGTRVAVEAGSSLRLGGEDGKEMELAAGRVSAEVAKQPAGKHVVLRTPLAMVTVHGTELTLESGADSTRLDVREGLVRMAHAKQDSEMEVAGGEFALATPDSELLGGLLTVTATDKPVASAPGDRDPVRWPFSPDSPWNTAIGAGAEFAPVKSPSLDFAGHGLAVLPAAHHRALFIARPGDPMVAVVKRYGVGEWMRLRLPPDVPRDGTRPRNLTILDPDQGLAHELIMAGPSGTAIQAMLCHTYSLRGTGMPPGQSGHTHSGMPLIAGVIRKGEMERGIKHALAASVIHHGLSRAGDGGHPFTWPARRVPMETRKLDAMAPTGNVHFGTLLAIPPEVDVTKLGLGTEGAAIGIARALQDYGAYVTHSYERAPNDGRGWVQPHLQLFAEGVPDSELRQLHGVVAKLAGYLRVVSNNQPDRVGGGGAPRQQPPPGLRAAGE